MKKIFLCLMFFCSLFAFADNKTTYIELLENNDFDALFTHLKKWEREDKKNPDLYFAYSQYELAAGGKTGFSSETYIIDENNEFAVLDPKNGKIVGYLNRDYFYEPKVINNAVGYLNKGISYAPDRFDLYFAKIHLFGQIGEYEKQSEAVIAVLDRSKKNDNKWLWEDNQVIPDGLLVMFDNIQDSYALWFNVFNTAAAEAVRKTAETQVKLYPNSLFGYNNLGLYYAFKEDYSTAVQVFLKGEKETEPDTVLYGNIAYCYELLGEKNISKTYYEKMIQSGTEEEQAFARERISGLEQN